MNMQAAEMKVLLSPTRVTAAGINGSFVDLQGFVNPGGRNFKAIWLVGAGTTAGTASGLIQGASTTAGTDAATVCTFTGLTATGGSEEKHFTVGATQRYVRFVGDVQTAKDMLLSCVILGEARYRP
jgi:hypothetical protein